MLRASLHSLLAHRVRLALTMVAIALGVAFMSGTFTFTATLQHDLDALLRAADAGTDVIVQHTAPAGEAGGNAGARPTIPSALLPYVRSVSGVAAADGVVLDQAQLTTVDGKLAGSGPGIATSWRDASTLDTMFPLRAGRPPSGPGEVAIDQTSATTVGYHLGDTVRVVIAGRATAFRVVGIVGFGTGNGPGRALTIFDLATAQQLFGKVGRFDEIDVAASPDSGGAGALRDRIAAGLPDGVQALTGAAVAAQSSADQAANLSFLTDALLAFAGIALFVGAFVIWNTFSIVLAQRTRELALLRALGAARRQVFGSVLVEAAVVGLTASVLGVGLGVLAARGLAAALSVFGLDLPTAGPRVPVGPSVLAVLTGTVITVLAALVPARRATQVAPVAAMRSAAPAPTPLTLRRASGGLLLAAVGAAALALGLSGGLSGAALVAGAGAVSVVLGVNLLTPLAVRPVVTVIAAPLSGLPGRIGRMARDNARHHPRRTAATATALMIGLAAVAGTTVLVTSLKAAAEAGIGRASRADLYVTSASSDTGFAPVLAAQVSAQTGVAEATEVRRSDAYVAGSPHQAVYGVDPATIEQLTDLGLTSGRLADLDSGGLLVSTAVAASHHWQAGSVVDVQFGQASRRSMTVVGTYAEKGPLGDYLVSLSTFDDATGRDQDQLVLVRASAGTAVPDLRARLSTLLTDFPGVQVLDQAGYESSVGSTLDQLLGLTTALLVLAVVIALLGIVNTLALSVTERTRELGVLRALGLGRGHLAATVTVEAAIIAVFGGVTGIALGIGLGAALGRILTGARPDVPSGQLLAYLLIAVVVAMLAAVAPARRAARLDILSAIGVDGA